jgi:hypothetical protein
MCRRRRRRLREEGVSAKERRWQLRGDRARVGDVENVERADTAGRSQTGHAPRQSDQDDCDGEMGAMKRAHDVLQVMFERS